MLGVGAESKTLLPRSRSRHRQTGKRGSLRHGRNESRPERLGGRLQARRDVNTALGAFSDGVNRQAGSTKIAQLATQMAESMNAVSAKTEELAVSAEETMSLARSGSETVKENRDGDESHPATQL